MIYTTIEGDMLDYICWKYYGKTSNYVEKVLAANTHLAEYGTILPAGIKIFLPVIDEPKSLQKIKLWQ